MTIKHSLLRNLSNMPGWRTDRKIIIIESDDWGSIRMPSLESFDILEKAGLNLRSNDAERYNLNDTLETEDDLVCLFEILYNFTDSIGNKAVFTPICVVANPDFIKIKESDFTQYFYEPFTETQKKYGRENIIRIFKNGIDNRIFVPQMHGREHLNVQAWMKALQVGEKDTIKGFEEGLWGFVSNQASLPGVYFQEAFSLSDISDLDYQKIIITEGLNLFENLFGYRADYFVPPNGVFNNSLNRTLAENGIKLRSTSKIQNETLGFRKKRKSFHWLGQTDKSGVRYITRNCFFEPNLKSKDWIDSCLYDIKVAFRWHKPAIISSHRVNYIGALNKSNRANGLTQLNKLLRTIVKQWPDIEFMTTSQLGQIISMGTKFDN